MMLCCWDCINDRNPYQLGMRNRLASHAAACLDRRRAFFGWRLFLVQTVPEQQTCGIPHSPLAFILPTGSVATCVLSNIGR
jgi:hypothetical protein